MTKRDEQYWRHRASVMVEAQVKLKFILHELMELMPETSGLHGFEFQQLNSDVNAIVDRHEIGQVDASQGVDEFFGLVFDAAVAA